MKTMLLAGTLALFCPSIIHSQQLATGKTTGEFLQMCEFVLDDKKVPTSYDIAYVNTGMCIGYIGGFLD
jgi:hypothetical protein